MSLRSNCVVESDVSLLSTADRTHALSGHGSVSDVERSSAWRTCTQTCVVLSFRYEAGALANLGASEEGNDERDRRQNTETGEDADNDSAPRHVHESKLTPILKQS